MCDEQRGGRALCVDVQRVALQAGAADASDAEDRRGGQAAAADAMGKVARYASMTHTRLIRYNTS